MICSKCGNVFEDCFKCQMTVKDVKEMLKDVPEDKQVGVWNSSGYGTLGELVLKDSLDKKII